MRSSIPRRGVLAAQWTFISLNFLRTSTAGTKLIGVAAAGFAAADEVGLDR